MDKKLIRLTEGDLHRIVKKSVNRIINEVELNHQPKYVCSKCGSENVYEKYWKGLNDGTMNPTDEYWCDDCEEYREVKKL